MILKKFVGTVLIFTLVLAALPAEPVQAASGVPGNGQFGYGMRITLNNPNLNGTLECAATLNLDWLVVDLPWAEFNPQQNNSPDWTQLDQVMRFAGERQISVMISLFQPPVWVLLDHGPDGELTYQWISTLVNRYPGTLQAIELFAGANTRKGWGTKPNPKTYAGLFINILQRLSEDRISISLVAGGLIPVQETDPEKAISDLKFLQKLYNNGIKDFMPIISLQMPHTTGDPLTPPDGQEFHYLRHYEEIRQLMLSNDHGNGLIWITRLLPPDGTINPSDQNYRSAQNAEHWLSQTLTQLQSQLYLGIVVLDTLNLASGSTNLCATPNIAAIIANQTDQTKGQKSTIRPLKQGRPKSQNISKGGPPA